MEKTLAEIAKIVEGELIGDGAIRITGLNGIKEANEGDLTFLAHFKYISLAKTTKASAILVSKDVKLPAKALIRTENPSIAFSKIASIYNKLDAHQIVGIHHTAVVADNALIGHNVAIGPYVVIDQKSQIGDNTTIQAGSYIGHQTIIGKNTFIYPNVTIRERIHIGNNVIIHSGSVIGSDGFGFEEMAGVQTKIPQIGTVVIEDDVEIGANVTIDRARFDKTIIGKGTKIDNLVQIAHNVIIGENCIIVSQVGISGSVHVGKGAKLAGQAGIAGHLSIGEGVIVAAQAGVTKSVPPHTVVSGYPATVHDKAKKINALLHRLPIYVQTIKDLKKQVEEVQTKIKDILKRN